jgi:hypothetical protein
MSKQIQDSVSASLSQVERERSRRQDDPVLGKAVDAIKTYQQQRFLRSYADLLESSRYQRAARFFVNDLYGPSDFARRDAQFQRVIPSLIRFFPDELAQTIDDMARLHALSETLDSAMAQAVLPAQTLGEADYRRAWRAIGRPQERARQLELVLSLGRELDRLTRKPILRQSLRLMRHPARKAGLAELQQFLEEGFDAFFAMHGADYFLSTVARREGEFAAAMFGEPAVTIRDH